MNNTLNLARKWRSRNFDQIVGQELSIKMLKNSLYLGQFFPVYLFSGQRGCGKTSTARVFAAAVNCKQLPAFQQNPKNFSIPCLTCESCTAMMQGQHPDFFEIDAASHTGVDTIRQIIDASQLLPLMGEKKIYLIDEAHMLSKASFNALLKILEEPPRSVLFILATTDDQKIIDTVKSRCFQLFFRPIEMPSLLNHLMGICQSENIAFDQEGLSLIIEQAQGSARDALNVLEQVRFSHSKVSRDAVLRVLGHLDDESLLTLIELAVSKKPADLLAWLHEVSFESYSAEFIWHRLAELVRAIIWMKHGVQPKQFAHYASSLQRIAKRCSWALLNELLDLLYSNEIVFNKTTAKHALLEMLLLQLCQKYTKDENESGTPLTSHSAVVEQTEDYVEDDEIDSDEDIEDDNDEEDDGAHAWNQFLKGVQSLNDPLLNSVFRQGKVIQFDSEKSFLEVQFSKEFSFFNDWLNDTQQQWMPLLKNAYGQSVSFNPLFTGTPVTMTEKKNPEPIMQHNVQSASQTPVQKHDAGFKKEVATSRFYKQVNKPVKSREPLFAISDAATWPKASMMLSYFPGTITEIKELGHER